jgi:hypothetical protein
MLRMPELEECSLGVSIGVVNLTTAQAQEPFVVNDDKKLGGILEIDQLSIMSPTAAVWGKSETMVGQPRWA